MNRNIILLNHCLICYASIPASYSYCCDGLYCPDYPIKLSVEVFSKTFEVQEALNLSCHKRLFEKTLRADVVPSNYMIKVRKQIAICFWSSMAVMLKIQIVSRTYTFDADGRSCRCGKTC